MTTTATPATATTESPLGPPGSGEIRRDFERPPAEVVARLSRLPIANIEDALRAAGYAIR